MYIKLVHRIFTSLQNFDTKCLCFAPLQVNRRFHAPVQSLCRYITFLFDFEDLSSFCYRGFYCIFVGAFQSLLICCKTFGDFWKNLLFCTNKIVLIGYTLVWNFTKSGLYKK